ncbi:MAG: glycosyltransferase [Fibrobacteraceae bacterium]|jgi:hypothetical protein|nr:glycosyltransferase [Fibrobacteraceae bacterium]
MSDKKKIIFWPDLYKEQGHWLPTLAWAEYLKNDYDITYMGIADCEEIVTKYNSKNATNFGYEKIFYCQEDAKDCSIYPLGYTNQIVTTPGNRWKTNHIWALAAAGFNNDDNRAKPTGGKDSVVYKNAKAIHDFWENASCDLLIGGFFTSLELLFFYYFQKNEKKAFKKEMNFAISTTYLRHPEEDPASQALQHLQAFGLFEQKKLLNMVYHDESDVDKLDKDPEITLEDFVAPLSDFHEFLPCTKTFDYAQYEHGSKVHYVEPCITNELGEPDEQSAKIDWDSLLATHKRIVFVTAGSQILDYKEKALILFQSIIDAMQASDMKEYHLILCAGGTLAQSLKSNYDNVTICGWVPQRQILLTLAQEDHKGSCAIIHGGLATIKECVYCNVPFLVLPLGKDQMDNALRLENCGINNYFYIEFIKPKCLLYFINQILQDYVSLSNLAALSKEFHDAEDSHIGARAIAHLAENGNLDDFDWGTY